MKIVLQRVSKASVSVAGETIGEIKKGLLALVCAEPDDTPETVAYLVRKTAAMRIFTDDQGKMNLSVTQVGGAVLAVSQFTLAAEWRKGNRPGFSKAAPPDQAIPLFEAFCAGLQEIGIPVETGKFGADMQVSLVNDGPVTIVMSEPESL